MTVEGLEQLLTENEDQLLKLQATFRQEDASRVFAQKNFEKLGRELRILEDKRQKLIHTLENKGVNFLDFQSKGILEGYL